MKVQQNTLIITYKTRNFKMFRITPEDSGLT